MKRTMTKKRIGVEVVDDAIVMKMIRVVVPAMMKRKIVVYLHAMKVVKVVLVVK